MDTIWVLELGAVGGKSPGHFQVVCLELFVEIARGGGDDDDDDDDDTSFS